MNLNIIGKVPVSLQLSLFLSTPIFPADAELSEAGINGSKIIAMATTRKNGLNGSQASDLITRNYNQGRKTFIVPLTFPDLSKATHLLERISYGADCWELRVDLLTLGTLEDTNVPPLSYVREQLRILREHSYNLPILYTVRTVSQGGQFPDDKTEEAHQLMLLGFDMGCEYVDVEVEWPSPLIESIVARGGTTKVVASYHDWTGNIRWTGDALINRYQAIARYGGNLSHKPKGNSRHLGTGKLN